MYPKPDGSEEELPPSPRPEPKPKDKAEAEAETEAAPPAFPKPLDESKERKELLEQKHLVEYDSLAKSELKMLETTAETSIELEKAREVTADRYNKLCEAEYEVEDVEYGLARAEEKLERYQQSTVGRLKARLIKLISGYPVVEMLEEKIAALQIRQDTALNEYEAATNAWKDALENERRIAEIHRKNNP